MFPIRDYFPQYHLVLGSRMYVLLIYKEKTIAYSYTCITYMSVWAFLFKSEYVWWDRPTNRLVLQFLCTFTLYISLFNLKFSSKKKEKKKNLCQYYRLSEVLKNIDFAFPVLGNL